MVESGGIERPIDIPAALSRWMVERVPDADEVEVGQPERCSGGYSAETFIAPVTLMRDGVRRHERIVLRLEVDEPAVYPQQAPGLDVEIEIQYRVMQAITGASGVPIAPLLDYEADRSVLGQPFFVMGYVDGLVPAVQPPYTCEGFFAMATPEQRRSLIDDGLRILAAIHRIDGRAHGLDWLVAPGTTPGSAAQLEIWERYLRSELDGRPVPIVDKALARLHADLPEDEPQVLCWGDARPGNMIWRDFRCVCVTDFENAAIGPAASDLGWWLMFDRCSHERAGVGPLDGEPTRAEQRQIYAAHAGELPPHLDFHELFAAVRYAAIHVRILNRMVARGHVAGDSQMWRQNSATACIAELLG